MNMEIIDKQIQKIMKRDRYQHVCRVVQLAGEIAEYYNLSVNKVKIAALIHDCAKNYSLTELKILIKKYDIKLSIVEKKIPKIWHAYIGAEIAKDVFKIDDYEILQAIRYHSTACKNLSLVGKAVYIADKIEPHRDFTGLKKIQKLLWEDMDLAMLELLDQEIVFLITKKLLIHPDTLEARNQIIMDKGIV